MNPATEMPSPMEGVVTPMPDHGSYSSETSSEASEIDDGAHIAPVGVDTPVQESSTIGPRGPIDPADPLEEEMVIHARAYQIEMFEKSLKQNIIVAMDTGSGKTQVAVLRIQAELEKYTVKIIWFLAPTVALCEQQFRVIKSQIGAAQIKLLSGADNVDTWSDKRIWDDYLKGVRVVVSTYQILLDAITHAFVQISRLCLIVFDEAHNCTGKHPGSKIMERYHINKTNGLPCPAILGLTASPIMRSNIDGIEKIEQTLDAVCKTPTIHREELLSMVKRPHLSPVIVPNSGDRIRVESITSLAKAVRALDIYQDPYILRLRRGQTENNTYMLRKALEKRDTPVIKQMQSLYRKSLEIHRQLGPWASEYFVYKAITQFLSSVEQDLTWFETWGTAEKQYLSNILRQVEIKLPRAFKDTTSVDLSDKFIALVQELQSMPENTRCIVFVLETATVAVLAQMLSTTESVSSRFQVGTMIGTSNYAARKRDLGEINQVKDYRDLEDFRMGKLNLLIATSIAEEGIDVPACNLVICFNTPPNVKSFIQRRGRARMENSRIILLLEEESSDQHDTWMNLEEMMKRCYEDDTRVAREVADLESLDINPDVAPLYIPSTGAQLDFDQAKSHLEHFCRKLTSKQYIDPRPYYIPEEINGFSDGIPRISAVVHLPSSLPQDIRQVKSLGLWYSEKNAFKDAAFQAFKAVYKAGLVNDNLMPLTDDILEGIETRSSTMKVNALWKPWGRIAQLWGESDEREQRELCLKDGDRVIARFEASLPCHFPKLPPFKIYWDADSTWTIETSDRSKHITACALKQDQSAALIDLAYGHRWQYGHHRWPVKDSAYILHLQSIDDIKFHQHVGQRAAEKHALNPEFIVRDTRGKPHLFMEWLPSKPSEELGRIGKDVKDEPDDVPWLLLRKWPKRKDFLHPVIGALRSGKRNTNALPISHCTLDTIDRSKAHFGSVIPSIIHMLEIYLTAEELGRTVLEEVKFSDLSLLLTAISSRAAGETTDYERLEFLGDSILKILTTVSVMIKHPNYPEGYLTEKKNRIVSNARLCRASVEKGLDKFVLTKRFTGDEWRHLYIEDLLSNEENTSTKRELSTKTLADVVESLIGAAFVDGGMPKAVACLQFFLPEAEWHDLIEAHILLSRKDVIAQSHPVHEPLEQLVGYTFQNKALLTESLTHISWGVSTSTDACMERLEFLGDSILDTVIVSAIWPHQPELSNNEMHLLRTACVNGDLLGFMVMEWCATQEATEISPIDLATIVTHESVPFWKYMRHRSSNVVDLQRAAEERHAVERETILDAMTHGGEYPWAQLAHLDIPKFFSDMFESLLGAIWVDSGSLETCKDVVERIGILPYLRRILHDKVNVTHPKNKLGELVGRDNKRVKYETEVRIEVGVKDLFCKVFVGEEFIVEVGGGVNPEEVATKAADEAYHLLLRRGNESDSEMTAA
ncbi:RNase3 domain-containing protein [Nemania diffusa]|nr:RNase3 domain-containing protein [Nemania diffusa]